MTYDFLSANTGITTISAANPNLDGSGSMQLVLTAAGNGTIIKSVTIKAVNPVLTGVVRLFVGPKVGDPYLYREVTIPEYPTLSATPIPAPVLLTYEVVLDGGLILQADDGLFASTQNAEVFNIIAEGLDRTYPDPLPPTCCSFKQVSANTGVGTISTANPNTDGSGTIVTIFTAGALANGSVVKTITIKALQNTHEGAVRLFISPDGGATWVLLREVWIPQTTQSDFEPSYKQVIETDLDLQAGYLLGAATQNAEGFAITAEGTDWEYVLPAAGILSRTLTIDHTQCGSSDSTDFPVLVSLSNATLKTTANGGHVANSNGYDIQFFADSGETTLLNWEVEFYDGAAGTLIAWVKIPTVSHTADTVFYMQYGDVSITTFQGGSLGSAWTNDYTMVQHLPDGTTLSASDSTSNGNDGTITGATATTGKIDGGAAFNGTSDTIVCGDTNLPAGSSAFTVSAWLYMPSLPPTNAVWPVVAWGLQATNDGHGIMVHNSAGTTSLVFLLWNNDLGYTWTPTANTWYKVTATYDGTTAVLFLNGAQVASDTRTISATATSVYIGWYTGGVVTYYSPINVDEVTISSATRSSDWILTEYNNQNDPGNIGTAGFLTVGTEY